MQEIQEINQIEFYKSLLIDSQKKEITETTLRTPLENLLNFVRNDNKINVIHEAKRETQYYGTPDFTINRFETDGAYKKLVGYIECKKLDLNIHNLVNSEQITKYNRVSKNIMLTNYREFILLNNQKIVAEINLDFNSDLEIRDFFAKFFDYEYSRITSSDEVTKIISEEAFLLSTTLRDMILKQKQEKTILDAFHEKFNSLFEEFGNSLKLNYDLNEFCDIYAQSLTYGLFIARLDGANFDEISKDPIIFIPKNYILLIEFLDTGYLRYSLPLNLQMIISSVVKNLNRIDLIYIEKNENRSKDQLIIYLYEIFLKNYDELRLTENRKESGVYYTPPQVTDFIVNFVGDILENRFENYKNRYLSENLKVLDFATGTGSFLFHIFEDMFEKSDNLELIKNQITQNIFGFELLFTPYIVAHTNLMRQLNEKKIFLNNQKERIGVFLTNTLDFSRGQISDLLPFLKYETETASKIKLANDILVIVGNPPYNSNSKHRDEKITLLVEDYKKNLNEKNIKPLNDDYIKFIRFAQYKVELAGHGVVGIITNNSFLDGVVHRQMRKSLLDTFDEIYILNLHGNLLKKEGDQNVFDITVGVAISIFVKYPKRLKEKKINYFSTLENGIISREDKFKFLKNKTVNWQELTPTEPNYWLVSKDETHIDEYNKFWSVTDIFNSYSVGIESHNDRIAIQNTKFDLNKLKEDFLTLAEKEIFNKYKIKEKTYWKLVDAIKSFDNYQPKKILYRPFDFRFTNYSKGFLARDRKAIMQNLLFDNMSFIFERGTKDISFKKIFVSKELAEVHVLGTANSKAYVAPLYIYTENMGEIEKDVNFTEDFNKKYLKKLNFSPTPEEILSYIYARLHSKKYREKYFEFLKTDFPKVPMTTNKTEFYKFAKLGQDLIELHTLKQVPNSDEVQIINESEDFQVTTIKHNSKENRLEINKNLSVSGVTKEIFDFEIGSYKVLDKWLKYRKKDKRELSTEDLEHLKNTILAIKETIQIMQKIEEI